MRVCLLLLGLGACATTGFRGTTSGGVGGVDVDVGDDCAPVRPTDVLELTSEVPAQVLRFTSPCGESGYQAELDDPDGAFQVSDVTDAEEVRFLEVEVALIATEPGTYEAQLAVGLPGSAQTVVEVFAQLDGEEG